MFVHSGRLPHVLTPEQYCSPAQYERELAALFRPGWHLAATVGELPRSGDFRTFELLGRSVQLRNINGRFHAFSNVCAHRHCLLTSQARGHDPKIRCQYHGWQYDCDGRTAQIPEPKNFAPFTDRAADSLEQFRVETCGQLLFVSLDRAAPPLAEQFADDHATIATAAGEGWRLAWSHAIDLPTNWKVPLENSVEGYHVPAVHPQTFKEAPTPERTTHILGPRSTSFHANRLTPSVVEQVLYALDDWLLLWLGHTPARAYSHHHFFPNLLLSSTDTTSLFIAIVPVTPERSRAVIRMFAYEGAQSSYATRQACRLWGKVNRTLARLILAEDFAIYPAIQRGLAASTQPGCLGAIEERVHAFQRWISDRTGEPTDGRCPA